MNTLRAIYNFYRHRLGYIVIPLSVYEWKLLLEVARSAKSSIRTFGDYLCVIDPLVSRSELHPVLLDEYQQCVSRVRVLGLIPKGDPEFIWHPFDISSNDPLTQQATYGWRANFELTL